MVEYRGHSFNERELMYKLPSYRNCKYLMRIGEDSSECNNFLKQNFFNSVHSKECAKDNLDASLRPFKLIIKTQDRNRLETCNEKVHKSLTKTATLKGETTQLHR